MYIILLLHKSIVRYKVLCYNHSNNQESGDIVATSDAQKRAVKKYQEKMKRVPLDMPIEDYESVKRIASYVGEPVNRYIKRAVAQRLAKDFLDLHDSAEAAGKTEDEYIEETIKERKRKEKELLDSMEKKVIDGRTVYISGKSPSVVQTASGVIEKI